MLLGSSLHLPPPVLVIPSPSDVLLLEAVSESPSGEWVVGAVSVFLYTDQHPPPFADYVMSLQLDLRLGLEQVLHPTHHH